MKYTVDLPIHGWFSFEIETDDQEKLEDLIDDMYYSADFGDLHDITYDDHEMMIYDENWNEV